MAPPGALHPLVVSLLAVGVLTSCAAAVPGGQVDEVIRTVAGAAAGPRTSYDDLVRAGRRVPLPSVPDRTILTERVLALGRSLNNDYAALAVDLACETFESGARRTGTPDVDTVLREMWSVVDELPAARDAVEFQCLLRDTVAAADEL